MVTNKQADPKPSVQANKRGAARLAAVQALYQMELTDSGLMDVVAEYENLRLGQEVDGDTYLAADESWFRGIVSGVVKDQRDIDPLIHGALPKDWPLDRLHTLLRAVLRAGVFELRSRKDVPVKVIINEYVEVAKSFFGDDEHRMVNGVLDTVGKAVRPF